MQASGLYHFQVEVVSRESFCHLQTQFAVSECMHDTCTAHTANSTPLCPSLKQCFVIWSCGHNIRMWGYVHHTGVLSYVCHMGVYIYVSVIWGYVCHVGLCISWQTVSCWTSSVVTSIKGLCVEYLQLAVCAPISQLKSLCQVVSESLQAGVTCESCWLYSLKEVATGAQQFRLFLVQVCYSLLFALLLFT